MPIVELLTSATAGVVAKFLIEQVREYKGRKGKEKNETADINKIEQILEPFQEKMDLNEIELKIIKENIEKLSEKLAKNGFDIKNETYKKWTLDLLNRKLNSIIQLQSTFKIELWIDRKGELGRDITIQERKYMIGDKVIVSFRSDRDCYFTLFNIGTTGKLTALFPNYLFQNNFIKANRIYTIPGEGYPFEYELSGPPGVEKLKAIATTSRQNLVDFEFFKEEIFRSSDSGAAARDISIVAKRMEDIPDDSWAEALYEFEVI